ncbi:PIN domain nuclease [Methylobacterium radiotolerans]|nr:PIN domain nuclease [Methylobacterium radiotolerans]
MEIVALDTAAFVRSAELRADFGLKTPDALHLAAAQLSGCTELWTNDKRLAAASHGLAVDILDR